MIGDGVIYDHRIQIWMGGSEDDDQVAPICKPCDKIKTANDATARAKVKRIITKQGPKKPGRIRSRGFDKAKRPMRGK